MLAAMFTHDIVIMTQLPRHGPCMSKCFTFHEYIMQLSWLCLTWHTGFQHACVWQVVLVTAQLCSPVWLSMSQAAWVACREPAHPAAHIQKQKRELQLLHAPPKQSNPSKPARNPGAAPAAEGHAELEANA